MYHTYTWITWLAVVIIALTSTRNPLYLVLVLLILLIQNILLTNRSNQESAHTLNHTGTTFSMLRLLLFILVTSTLFNGLSSHFGNTILMVIPGKIPVLSGPISLESLIYGLINGLVLTGLLTAFLFLNAALPMRSLIRLTPQAFYPLALVVSIAITFFPATRRQLDQVREAQAIRGHHLRGIRDWTPLVMPLLIGGLERALQLAETMTSRGFAGREGKISPVGFRLGMLAGLIMILVGGALRLSSNRPALEIALILLGTALIFGEFWKEGRQRRRTIYKREPWRIRDILVILGTVVSLAFFTLELPGVEHPVLSYNPYPLITPPGFDPWIGLATLGMMFPMFIFLLSRP